MCVLKACTTTGSSKQSRLNRDRDSVGRIVRIVLYIPPSAYCVSEITSIRALSLAVCKVEIVAVNRVIGTLRVRNVTRSATAVTSRVN